MEIRQADQEIILGLSAEVFSQAGLDQSDIGPLLEFLRDQPGFKKILAQFLRAVRDIQEHVCAPGCLHIKL